MAATQPDYITIKQMRIDNDLWYREMSGPKANMPDDMTDLAISSKYLADDENAFYAWNGEAWNAMEA